MVLGRVFVLFAVSIAIPINLSPCRLSLEKLVCKVQGVSPQWMHLVITFGTIITCLLVAIFYPNATFMFHFLGGFCAAIMALIVPAMLHTKLSGDPLTSWKNLLIISTAVLLSLAAFSSVVIDLVNES